MKEIKLSFPYPSTSRHNLSQDKATSLSMGLVVPVRTVEVLPGDSHRISTSFSIVSNPLVKPLLQGVRLRYCRFWVPRRIYHLDQRANNTDFDPIDVSVRALNITDVKIPVTGSPSEPSYMSNYQASSLFDYLGYSNCFSNYISDSAVSTYPDTVLDRPYSNYYFNAEPYLAYIDICRNYFADSATGVIGWYSSYGSTAGNSINKGVCVSPLNLLDKYIDGIQNSKGLILPYDPASSLSSFSDPASFLPYMLISGSARTSVIPTPLSSLEHFSAKDFGVSHLHLCVPLNRPDRLSRLFDTRALTSQSATIAPNEVSIGNLSFLTKFQRYITRKFFGDNRFTGVMYSIFGQKVPHVDSPVLLDIFDYEIGSELVASNNATEASNPGVLGGFFASAGNLTTSNGGFKRRYTFNEYGYIVDVVYIMPRLFRTAFPSDFLPLEGSSAYPSTRDGFPMTQGNFVPDFNGVGWQQPSFVSCFRLLTYPSSGGVRAGDSVAFCCEPSWQQYRTLPDTCSGLMNPVNGQYGKSNYQPVLSSVELNSPLFTFNDRMSGFGVYTGFLNSSTSDDMRVSRALLSQFYFTDPADLNRIFGVSDLSYDNFFAVFRFAHQAKRQVTKRFTLTFA